MLFKRLRLVSVDKQITTWEWWKNRLLKVWWEFSEDPGETKFLYRQVGVRVYPIQADRYIDRHPGKHNLGSEYTLY